MTDRLDDAPAALRRALAAVAAGLGVHELRVLVLLAVYAWAGKTRYVCLAVRRDPRDLRQEVAEERSTPASTWRVQPSGAPEARARARRPVPAVRGASAAGGRS